MPSQQPRLTVGGALYDRVGEGQFVQHRAQPAGGVAALIRTERPVYRTERPRLRRVFSVRQHVE